MKGLIIKPYWADLILNGEKTIEVRGSKTNIRGTIGIIKSRTQKIFGEVDLFDCIPLTKDNFDLLKEKHKLSICYEELVKIYPHPYGWCMKNQTKYTTPQDYTHKKGCVIWVNLNQQKEA
jgi:predicted transcriptional regulator